MAEIPKPTHEELQRKIQAELLAAMSPECRQVFNTTPGALAGEYHNLPRAIWLRAGDAPASVLQPYLDAAQAQRDIAAKLKVAIGGCKTRKQFVDRFPEFSNHAPPEEGVCATLPAVSGVVADLVKLGWVPKVTK